MKLCIRLPIVQGIIGFPIGHKSQYKFSDLSGNVHSSVFHGLENSRPFPLDFQRPTKTVGTVFAVIAATAPSTWNRTFRVASMRCQYTKTADTDFCKIVFLIK